MMVFIPRHTSMRHWALALSVALLPSLHAYATGEQLLADNAACRLWLLYPAEKVLKRDALAAGEKANSIALSAAKGEFEPFVLVLRPKQRKPLLDVRFDWQPIRPAKGKGPALSLEYQRVGYVHIDTPSGVSVFPDSRDRFKDAAIPFGGTGKTGYFPDRLIPEKISEAPIGENTQFWFTLRVPYDAAPGAHRGSIRLRVRSAPDVVIPLDVNVFDFALPKSPTLKNTTCWSPQYYGRNIDKAFLKALYRDMAEHRQTPDPILPQPKLRRAKDGTMEVDTAEYDEMVEYCMKELGLKHFFFPHAGGAWYTNVYFLWHTPATWKQRWYGAPFFDEQHRLTPQIRKVFGGYVKTMRDHFERKGWLGRVYMTTMDEPHTPDDFRAVRAFAGMVKAAAPGVKLFCTTYPREGLLGAIDAWCPQQYDEAMVRERQAKGEEFMFYKNWLHLIDMPMVNPRLQGWIAWKTKAAGWLTYATMGRWRRAWDEPYAIYSNIGMKAWGLGLWWYPDPMGNGIIKSVRWEIMREGAEDYEYLALLAKRLAALPEAKRQSAAAKEAAAFLETAADKVVLYPRVLPRGPDNGWEKKPNFTRSHRVVWELRNEAARLVEALGSQP